MKLANKKFGALRKLKRACEHKKHKIEYVALLQQKAIWRNLNVGICFCFFGHLYLNCSLLEAPTRLNILLERHVLGLSKQGKN